jgi:predicted alpha/beta-hydrolase family hydrolase
MVERIRVDVTPSEHVTASAYSAASRDHAGISLILAHGAGANQTSGFMVHFATALTARGITLRWRPTFILSACERSLRGQMKAGVV